MSNLRVVNVSPKEEKPSFHERVEQDDILESRISTPEPHAIAAAFSTPSAPGPVSPMTSPEPPSVFDTTGEIQQENEQYTDPSTVLHNSGLDWSDPDDSFNLKAPPPAIAQSNSVEALSARLFSSDHLDLIFRNPKFSSRFSSFLGQYRRQHTSTLKQYAELRKAVAAIEYANTIANQFSSPLGPSGYVAASLDPRFEASLKQTVEELVEEALPAYLTHRLVSVVTDTLVKEITGNIAPVVHELIPSLAEVYCITDPSLPDNPIVYASEEFYGTTQYGREYVLGRNCRFLQGPRTSASSVRRLIETLAKGEESCETILNYRRDGTPFLNLLMIAPLYDNKGSVRYFLGCQIDVTSLVENGRGLESFSQLLAQDQSNFRFDDQRHRAPREALRDLTQLLSIDEAETVRAANPKTSFLSQSRPKSSLRSDCDRPRSSRIVLGLDHEPKSLWPSATLGPSGRLPGVYQNYLLVRPYPSLRITFTSPTLRIPGILQTKLLDRVAGPPVLLTQLEGALASGQGVTAKVTWLPSGKVRWLHCTPLFGADDNVGVWMVVMVEEESGVGSLNSSRKREGLEGFTSGKLYAEYLRREGGSARPGTSSSTREMREADACFRDF